MKSPDVIYVEFSEEVNLAFEKQPFEETPAYIRKEALMEWLQERIKCGEDEGLMANYMADLAYKDVIDHINSL